jgi:dihydroanticapsin dehydrogenase
MSADEGPLINLTGQTALVTGSTRGIGSAIAKRLASLGATVVVNGRTASDGKSIVEAIRDNGSRAIFVEADVRDPDDIESLITRTLEFGGVDILINNAAFETNTSPEDVEIDTWEAIIETDLRAYWLLAKAAYPSLTESSNAAIVNIGSNHATATQPSKFPYNMVKTAIDGLTRSLAVAWGIDGIRVNSVNPGWTLVERISEDLGESEMDYLNRLHPLGRVGKPENIADVTAFLASDMANFVTGESITVDGGRIAVLQDDLYLEDQNLR